MMNNKENNENKEKQGIDYLRDKESVLYQNPKLVFLTILDIIAGLTIHTLLTIVFIRLLFGVRLSFRIGFGITVTTLYIISVLIRTIKFSLKDS